VVEVDQLAMTDAVAPNERRWQDCVSSRDLSRKQRSVGYSFFVLGAITLVIHHGWVAGLRQDPALELLFTGSFLMVWNAAAWVTPTLRRIETGANVPRWRGFLYFLGVTALAAALTWAIGRFGYGVNLFA